MRTICPSNLTILHLAILIRGKKKPTTFTVRSTWIECWRSVGFYTRRSQPTTWFYHHNKRPSWVAASLSSETYCHGTYQAAPTLTCDATEHRNVICEVDMSRQPSIHRQHPHLAALHGVWSNYSWGTETIPKRRIESSNPGYFSNSYKKLSDLCFWCSKGFW